MKFDIVFKVVIPILLFLSCCKEQNTDKIKKEEGSINESQLTIDSTNTDDISDKNTEELNISYSLHELNDSTINKFKDTYKSADWKTICAINRIDPNRLNRADSIVIPDTVLADLMDYSPFAKEIAHKNISDRIVFVSYAIQAFALYRNDSLIRWGPVSMGAKKTPTPTGYYHTNWKSKRQISTEDSSWILNWYFNIVNASGVSFHEYELPGYPASHSCIRMREEDAQFLYYFAEQWKLDEKGRQVITEGTPVIIFGSYPWGKTRPWFHLSRDRNFLDISKDSLETILKKKP